MTIGPSFSSELKAAGLMGAPFSWDLDGNITGRGNLTDTQNTTLDAVIAAHDPATPDPMTPAFKVEAKLRNDKALCAIIRKMADDASVTEDAMIDMIKVFAT